MSLINQSFQLRRLHTNRYADVHDSEERRLLDLRPLDGPEGGVGNPRSPCHLDLRKARLGPRLSDHPAELLGFSEIPAELARLP